jgi:hypothetical protein
MSHLVLENLDMLHEIYKFLDFATISTIAPVCKTFAMLSEEYYIKKLDEEVLIPAKMSYNNFYEKTVRLYLSKDQYVLLFHVQRASFVNMLYEFEAFIIPFTQNNHWLLFLYDLNIMENMFVFVSRINQIIEKNRDIVFFNQQLPNYLERTELYFRLQSIFDILDNYFYIEYPDLYINSQLHMMAKFKKIKKQSNMKKIALIKALQRPLNEVYYI